MEGQARFCTGCGSPLLEGARFCTGCGTAAAMMPASPAPAAPAAAPAAPATAPGVTPAAPAAPAATAVAPQSGERVLAVIPNATLKGGFMGMSSKAGTLVLTERRVIFAHTTSEMMKRLVADARDGAKADGKGFFGQWGAQLGAYAAFAQRYLEMDPNVTLAESPENLSIENAAIRKAQVKVGVDDQNGAPGTDKLVVKTDGGKTVWTLGSGAGQAKQALIAAGLI